GFFEAMLESQVFLVEASGILRRIVMKREEEGMMGHEKVRVDGDCLAINGNGSIILSAFSQCAAEVDVGLEVAVFYLDAFFIARDGLVDLAFVFQGETEVIVGEGKVWIDLESLLVGGDG